VAITEQTLLSPVSNTVAPNVGVYGDIFHPVSWFVGLVLLIAVAVEFVIIRNV
jgi:hypothetical protein